MYELLVKHQELKLGVAHSLEHAVVDVPDIGPGMWDHLAETVPWNLASFSVVSSLLASWTS
jgi:hypothetical protein